MWTWRKRRETAAVLPVQLRSGERHPFGLLREYVPLGQGEARLYRAVREAVPVVDAAIYKLIRLTGGVTADCEDPAAEGGSEGIFADRSGGAGAVWHQRLFGRIPGLSADLRPGGGGDRAVGGKPGDRGAAVGTGGGYRDPGGRATAGVASARLGPGGQARQSCPVRSWCCLHR